MKPLIRGYAAVAVTNLRGFLVPDLKPSHQLKISYSPGEPRKPWRRTHRVRALPSFLTLDGPRLSSSERCSMQRGPHLKARQVSGLSCSSASLSKMGWVVPGRNVPWGAKLCLERWGMSLALLRNTAAPHAERITEEGEIHGRYPGLPHLAGMFFTFREPKRIQRTWWYSIVRYFPHIRLKGGFLEA